MYKLLILSFTLALFTLPSTGQEKERIVLIETSMGNLKAKLYNDTPIHRDNFIELAKSGQYDGTLFYRVIKDFIIQGGSADSRNAVAGQELGYGREITIDAEIKPHHYHKKGALAAARTGDEVNPQKESSGSQFYIVTGTVISSGQIASLENRMTKQKEQKIFERLARPVCGWRSHRRYPRHQPSGLQRRRGRLRHRLCIRYRCVHRRNPRLHPR